MSPILPGLSVTRWSVRQRWDIKANQASEGDSSRLPGRGRAGSSMSRLKAPSCTPTGCRWTRQFRAAFAAYQAELDALPPPAERNEWQRARQVAASQRLAVITGTHPHAFPNLGEPDLAWAWYRDNNPYATAALPRHGRFRLPPGAIATD